jgi:hypothetical protein
LAEKYLRMEVAERETECKKVSEVFIVQQEEKNMLNTKRLKIAAAPTVTADEPATILHIVVSDTDASNELTLDPRTGFLKQGHKILDPFQSKNMLKDFTHVLLRANTIEWKDNIDIDHVLRRAIAKSGQGAFIFGIEKRGQPFYSSYIDAAALISAPQSQSNTLNICVSVDVFSGFLERYAAVKADVSRRNTIYVHLAFICYILSKDMPIIPIPLIGASQTGDNAPVDYADEGLITDLARYRSQNDWLAYRFFGLIRHNTTGESQQIRNQSHVTPETRLVDVSELRTREIVKLGLDKLRGIAKVQIGKIKR